MRNSIYPYLSPSYTRDLSLSRLSSKRSLSSHLSISPSLFDVFIFLIISLTLISDWIMSRMSVSTFSKLQCDYLDLYFFHFVPATFTVQLQMSRLTEVGDLIYAHSKMENNNKNTT